MTSAAPLVIRPQGDRELVMSRGFAAPPALVFQAHSKPELLKRWLGQMPGWEWKECTVDFRVGGRYRWAWLQVETGYVMGMGGEYLEIVPDTRIVCTELFDDAWYPGAAHSTVEFRAHEGGTLLVNTMRYASAEALKAVLESPMESGLKVSYDLLEALVTS